ncbi:AAA family ATPase [Polyangium aurulentum]|uniref:AAA family ATPase n=1 Tax=Polyangium aurulentum TaxID=2567896 RepID=UPI0010AE6A5C|nr:ATP-binding protein [Polyangium aurulentum]UQA62270.1 AAA family ATPase [Polyangium aurulentum]
MIERLRLQNFKGHRDTTVELGRLTVLVGPNGSGKTSVLQALDLLHTLVWPKLPGHRLPMVDSFFRGEHSAPLTMDADGVVDGTPWALAVKLTRGELALQPSDGKYERPIFEKLACDLGNGRKELGNGGFATAGESPLWRWLTWARLFRFDASQIAAPDYSEFVPPQVLPNGRNTASVLANLKLGDEASFAAIEKSLKALVPHLERIRLRTTRVTVPDLFPDPTGHTHEREANGFGIVFDFKGAPEVSATAASEGTLILLALLTALHSSSKSTLVLIDDIEHSLHPMAQVQLMKQLKELLTQFPDLQIVATTHSPYILDAVDPSDVRVFYPRSDGGIVTKRLSDHPDAQRAKGMLTSGELWSAESEAWVLGEDAAQ